MRETRSRPLAIMSLALILAACGGGSTTPPGTPVTALTDSGAGSLRDALAAAAPGDTLRLTQPGTLSLQRPLVIDKNVTIVATGVTIDAAGKGRALEVASGATVTVKGGTLTGGTGGSVDLAAVSVRGQAQSVGTWGGNLINRGTLTLDGTAVQNGRADNGGGLLNTAGATLTLKNVTMTGNQATIPTPDLQNESTGSGGAIANRGTLTIESGVFKNNAAVFTGGVIQHTAGTLTIKGGTFESNACTNPACGGGVLGVFGDSQTSITGGTFTSNTTTADGGGGVLLQGGASTVTLAGGTFSGNTSTFGGVYNGFQGGTLNITGGTFENNTAGKYGGAFQVNQKGTAFTMTGGTIRGNTAGLAGGGISSGISLTLTGGIIEDNATEGTGGGINTFALTGVKHTVTLGSALVVRNNHAAKDGGGVSAGAADPDSVTYTLEGATIQGNTAKIAGGGLSLGNHVTLNLSGGRIAGNTAVKTGGGIVVGGRVTMTGGSIEGNTVTNRTDIPGQDLGGGGGGVRMYAGSSMTASGGTIRDNTAWYGGAVEVNAAYATAPTATFTLSGATVSGNRADGNVGGGFFNDGSVTVQSGSVTGNSARDGGGVFNTRVGVYAQSGGSVTGNTPNNVVNGQ